MPKWLKRRHQLKFTVTAEYDMVNGWHKVDPITVDGPRFFTRRRAEWFGREIVRAFYRCHKLYEYKVVKINA